MPVAMIMSMLMDLAEIRGFERLEADIAALPVEHGDPFPIHEDPEPWDGLS